LDNIAGSTQRDALTAIRSRYSCPSYNFKPVDEDLIRQIVDPGRLAPSANNVRHWEFVVVTDPGLRRQIADLTI